MNQKTPLNCEFIKGEYDYVDTDVCPVKLKPLEEGGTLGVVRVAYPSGEWVMSGEAFQSEDGLELVCHTVSDGEIAFELYGCELKFYLKDVPYNPNTKCILKSICKLDD